MIVVYYVLAWCTSRHYEYQCYLMCFSGSLSAYFYEFAEVTTWSSTISESLRIEWICQENEFMINILSHILVTFSDIQDWKSNIFRYYRVLLLFAQEQGTSVSIIARNYGAKGFLLHARISKSGCMVLSTCTTNQCKYHSYTMSRKYQTSVWGGMKS